MPTIRTTTASRRAEQRERDQYRHVSASILPAVMDPDKPEQVKIPARVAAGVTYNKGINKAKRERRMFPVAREA